MPVTNTNLPTVQVSVPVPTPVQSKPKSPQSGTQSPSTQRVRQSKPPVSFGGGMDQRDQTTTPIPKPKRPLSAVILPWSAPQRMSRKVKKYANTPDPYAEPSPNTDGPEYAGHGGEFRKYVLVRNYNGDRILELTPHQIGGNYYWHVTDNQSPFYHPDYLRYPKHYGDLPQDRPLNQAELDRFQSPEHYSRKRYSHNLSQDERTRAKKVDLIVLPNDVEGTNCGNCKYLATRSEKDKDQPFCSNKQVDQDIQRNWCCALWDADGTKRVAEMSGKKKLTRKVVKL